MSRTETGYIILTVVFKFEDEVWTAECMELGTATFGETLQEAEQDMQEAILLHLNTLEAVGEREAFFREHDIKIHPVQPKHMHIDLPFEPNIFVSQKIQPINQAVYA
jgi:predicted RNase H-like HicB family nuclease